MRKEIDSNAEKIEQGEYRRSDHVCGFEEMKSQNKL